MTPDERAELLHRARFIAEAYREHDNAKLAVSEWVEQQTGDGRLVRNDQAPAWRAYEAALQARNKVQGEIEQTLTELVEELG